MLLKVVRALTLLSFSLTAQATQSLSNTGLLTGWDFINQEHEGTVQHVTNVYYDGPDALKMTQTYDPIYTGRYHSEVVKDNIYELGDSGFYGFAFRLQQDWQFSPPQVYNIAQFIGDFSDLDSACDDWMPTSMVWLYGNQLYTRVKWGSDICHQEYRYFTESATVSTGVWNTVVIQATWASDNTGQYKLWFNGAKILDYRNIPTTLNYPGRYYGFRVGLYANGWHDNSTMYGTQGTRQVWYDQIAAGTTFADADPAQWSRKKKRSRIVRGIDLGS